MNQTQTLIIAGTFGAILSFPTAESIFLEEIMPIILKTASSEILLPLTILYFIMAVLVFMVSVGIYCKIIKNITWTYNYHPTKFNKFMIKNIITFFISFILALLLRSILF